MLASIRTRRLCRNDHGQSTRIHRASPERYICESSYDNDDDQTDLDVLDEAGKLGKALSVSTSEDKLVQTSLKPMVPLRSVSCGGAMMSCESGNTEVWTHEDGHEELDSVEVEFYDRGY